MTRFLTYYSAQCIVDSRLCKPEGYKRERNVGLKFFKKKLYEIHYYGFVEIIN